VKVNTEGTNMEPRVKLEKSEEAEIGMTERITVMGFKTWPAPRSTVKAKGMSDTSSNSKWFNLTSSMRQHSVFAIIRAKLSTRDMGTEEGDRVAQNTL
jgi:hypothetical protein